MAERQQDIETLKRRGRRRLVGAVALVLAAVIVLPMVFDPEPRSGAPAVSVRIPGENDAPFKPKPVPKPVEKKAEAPAAPVEKKPEEPPGPNRPSRPRPPRSNRRRKSRRPRNVRAPKPRSPGSNTWFRSARSPIPTA
jgi:DedD protein